MASFGEDLNEPSHLFFSWGKRKDFICCLLQFQETANELIFLEFLSILAKHISLYENTSDLHTIFLMNFALIFHMVDFFTLYAWCLFLAIAADTACFLS